MFGSAGVILYWFRCMIVRLRKCLLPADWQVSVNTDNVSSSRGHGTVCIVADLSVILVQWADSSFELFNYFFS